MSGAVAQDNLKDLISCHITANEGKHNPTIQWVQMETVLQRWPPKTEANCHYKK